MAIAYRYPGVYVEEVGGGPRPITPVGTSTPAFVGEAPRADAHVNEAYAVNNWSHFVREFVPQAGGASTPLSHAVYGFFLNGGARCYVVNVGHGKPVTGTGRERAGLQVLEQLDNISIVGAPGYSDQASYEAVISHCELLKDRVAILDPPEQVDNIDDLTKVIGSPPKAAEGKSGGGGGGGGGGPAAGEGGLLPRVSSYATFYFPWIKVLDPLGGQQVFVPPSGHIAGLWARSDATRGVHKAPANEVVRGALDLRYPVTNAEQADLNDAGVNVIRFFDREGIMLWGARTRDPESEWRYLNLRRLFIMMEQSILRSTRWLVFEPNDRSTWKNVTRDCTAFLTHLWRDGALVGRTPQEAFFVQCNEESNPPESIDLGLLITVIGVAAVKPAEFIVFRLHQWEGASAIAAVA
jgi:phage tail sheath protein FI